MSRIIQAYTKLATTDFSKTGTGSVANMTGSVYMYDTTAGGYYDYTILVKAVPTAPYSFTVHCTNYGSLSTYQSWGICLKDSVSGKLICHTCMTNGTVDSNFIRTQKMTNETTWSADYTLAANLIWNPQWFRYVDNNTNRYSYLSRDGINWVQYDTQSRTDFITPNQIGICVNSYSTSTGCLFDHFKVDYSG